MYNASVHMFPEVKEATCACGECLKCVLHLNHPISIRLRFFSARKAMLNRNEELDWMSTHYLELSSLTPLIARREYKTCVMPLCSFMVEDDDEIDILICTCNFSVFNYR